MPNDELIGQLEGLREGYATRLRAANGLLTALKTSTGALGKAGRALRDYAEADAGAPATVDGDKLAAARNAFDTLRLRDDAVDPLLPELRRETKSLTGTVAALRDAAAALRGEAVDVVRLDRALTALRADKSGDPALAALVPALEGELDRGQRTLGATFGEALRHAFAERGIALGGHPPRSEAGRFLITMDFARRGAALSYGKELVVKRAPLSVDAIVKVYDREAKAIMGRNENAENWIKAFRDAWERAGRKGADGRANIVDCYYQLVLLRQGRGFRAAPGKTTIVDYTRAQFAYDFVEITQLRRTGIDGKHAVMHAAAKSQAESVERSIFIVQGANPHDGGYVGDVSFQ